MFDDIPKCMFVSYFDALVKVLISPVGIFRDLYLLSKIAIYLHVPKVRLHAVMDFFAV